MSIETFGLLSNVISWFMLVLVLLILIYSMEKENEFQSSEKGFKVFLEKEKTKRIYYKVKFEAKKERPRFIGKDYFKF